MFCNTYQHFLKTTFSPSKMYIDCLNQNPKHSPVSPKSHQKKIFEEYPQSSSLHSLQRVHIYLLKKLNKMMQLYYILVL